MTRSQDLQGATHRSTSPEPVTLVPQPRECPSPMPDVSLTATATDLVLASDIWLAEDTGATTEMLVRSAVVMGLCSIGVFVWSWMRRSKRGLVASAAAVLLVVSSVLVYSGTFDGHGCGTALNCVSREYIGVRGADEKANFDRNRAEHQRHLLAAGLLAGGSLAALGYAVVATRRRGSQRTNAEPVSSGQSSP